MSYSVRAKRDSILSQHSVLSQQDSHSSHPASFWGLGCRGSRVKVWWSGFGG